MNPQILLSDYQQLMLKISRVAPYNAIHAVGVQAALNIDKLGVCINFVIQQLGLGYPVYLDKNKCVRFQKFNQPVTIETRHMNLDEHVNEEMNHAFASSALPLRFFLISDKNKNYFSITYDHWLADGYALYRLMNTIFALLENETIDIQTLQSPSFRTCFKHLYPGLTNYHRILTLLKIVSGFSCTIRASVDYNIPQTSNCYSYLFQTKTLMHLKSCCKSKGITFNDLFLTLLIQLFEKRTLALVSHPTCNKTWWKPRRNKLMIAVAANLRPYSLKSLSQAFSVWLGILFFSFKPPFPHSFDELSQLVARKTRRLKNNHAAVKQPLLFNIQNKHWDKNRRKYQWFRKNTPLMLAISNMHLTDNTVAMTQNVNEYIRFSPVAMTCPILFNITTFNQSLALSITYNNSYYTAKEVQDIRQALVQAMEQL